MPAAGAVPSAPILYQPQAPPQPPRYAPTESIPKLDWERRPRSYETLGTVVVRTRAHEDPLERILREEDRDLVRKFKTLRVEAYIAEKNRVSQRLRAETERLDAETEALSRDIREQKETTPGVGSVLMDLLYSLWLQAGMDLESFQQLAGRIDWGNIVRTYLLWTSLRG